MKNNNFIVFVMFCLTFFSCFIIGVVDDAYALGPTYIDSKELVIFDADHWNSSSNDYKKTDSSIVMGQSEFEDSNYSSIYDAGYVELVEDSISGNYIKFTTNGWWNSTPTLRYGSYGSEGVNIEGVSYVYMTIMLDEENLKKYKSVGAYSKNVIGSETSTYDGNKALVLAVGEDSGVTYSTWVNALNGVIPNEWTTLELPVTNGTDSTPANVMKNFNFFFGKPLSATMSLKKIFFSKVKRDTNKITVLFDAEHWSSSSNNYTENDTSITMGSSSYNDAYYSAFYNAGSVELIEDFISGNYLNFTTNGSWDSTPTLRYGPHGGDGVNIENISYVYMTVKFDSDNLNKFKTNGAYSKNVIGSESSTYNGDKALVFSVGENSGVTYTTWINALKNVNSDEWITLELPITNGVGSNPSKTMKVFNFFFGKPFVASMSLKNIYVSQRRLIPEKIITIFDANHWTKSATDYIKDDTSITMGYSIYADAHYSSLYDAGSVKLIEDNSGNYISFSTNNWWNSTPTLRYGPHGGEGANINDVSHVYITIKVDEKNLKKFKAAGAYSKNVIGTGEYNYDGDRALVLALGEDSGITYTTWINALRTVVPNEWNTIELPVTNGINQQHLNKQSVFEFFFGKPLDATMSLKKIEFTNRQFLPSQIDIKLANSSYSINGESSKPLIVNTVPVAVNTAYKYLKFDLKCSNVSKILESLANSDNDFGIYFTGNGFKSGGMKSIGVKKANLKLLLEENKTALENGKTVTLLLPLSNTNKFGSYSIITGINMMFSFMSDKNDDNIEVFNVSLTNDDGMEKSDYLDENPDSGDDSVQNPVTNSNIIDNLFLLVVVCGSLVLVKKHIYRNV